MVNSPLKSTIGKLQWLSAVIPARAFKVESSNSIISAFQSKCVSTSTPQQQQLQLRQSVPYGTPLTFRWQDIKYQASIQSTAAEEKDSELWRNALGFSAETPTENLPNYGLYGKETGPNTRAAKTQNERTLISQLLSHFKQTSEVRQYLKFYGRTDSDRFAIVKLSGDVLNNEDEAARIASSLAFLHRIGLVPIVVHGAGLFTGRRAGAVSAVTDAVGTGAAAAAAVLRAAEDHMVTGNAKLVQALAREGVEGVPFLDGVFGAVKDTEYEGELGSGVGRIKEVDVDAITSTVAAGRIPIVAAIGRSADHDDAAWSNGEHEPRYTFPTHDAAIALAKMVQPLKVIWLRPEGGLKTSNGELVRNLDLCRDAPHLVSSLADHADPSSSEAIDEAAQSFDGGSSATAEAEFAAKAEACVEELDLSPTDASSLVELASFHSVLRVPGATVSVTTPENLAQEIFTHKGAGTLITRGERVFVHQSLHTIDVPRLYSLIGKAFNMQLPEGYIEGLAASGKLKRVYITEEYRGAAVVLDSDGIADGVSYLDKFAVDPSAQGDKLGEVLWKAMVQRERKLFWRSRSSNRVNPWYYEQSHGCYKSKSSPTGVWTVFWRNLEGDEVMRAVDSALAMPATFPTNRDPRLRAQDRTSDEQVSPAGIPTLK